MSPQWGDLFERGTGRMVVRTSFLAVGILLSGSLCRLTAQEQPLFRPVAEKMQEFVDSADLAGAVTVVIHRDKLVHASAVGWADLDAKRPMTLDTLFSIASMTKPISAVGALILCDEGKLSLDEPISKHLSNFAKPPQDTVTLRHLLTHTSGIVGNQMVTQSIADSVQTLAKQPLAFEPGKQWTYGPSITVAGRLTEVVAGVPYEEFLRTRIFEPLQMTSATFQPVGDRERLVAKIYNKAGDKLTVTNNLFLGPIENRPPNPSGGLYASALDVARFYRMLLHGGELDNKRVLSEKLAREMTTPQTGDLTSGFVPGSQWGLGVGIVREPGGVTAALHQWTFGHGGLYGTQVWADPVNQTIYILLIQRVGLINADASIFRKEFHNLAAAEIAKIKN
jgi:CubicO group peptidase (beta-lactamase class C family)